jgi:hypothetical protein
VSAELCERCGHLITEHHIFHDAVPPEMEGRLTEMLIPGLASAGFYCPHLDMVKGEDYER